MQDGGLVLYLLLDDCRVEWGDRSYAGLLESTVSFLVERRSFPDISYLVISSLIYPNSSSLFPSFFMKSVFQLHLGIGVPPFTLVLDPVPRRWCVHKERGVSSHWWQLQLVRELANLL